MKACPTEAIRVKKGIANINSSRCIDCGNCLRVCPADAFYVEQDDLASVKEFKNRVVIFPSVMIGQFPEKFTDNQIYNAMLKLWFTHIFEVEQPISVLIDALHEELREAQSKPLISSFCPAIVRLIQYKYPSLVPNIAKLRPPHDLVAFYVRQKFVKQGFKDDDTAIIYVSPCSAKFAAMKKSSENDKSLVQGVVSMKDFYNQVMNALSGPETINSSRMREQLTSEGVLWSLARGEASLFKERAMAIDGVHNVLKFIERLENNEIPELDFLDLKSCDQGCAGGILMTGNRFLTVERLQKRAKELTNAERRYIEGIDTRELKRLMKTQGLKPVNSFTLDTDTSTAIQKMEKANKILCHLPGVDCGGCGAPNCHALAEDIVQGKARMNDCIFLQRKNVFENKLTIDKALAISEKTWGVNRFESDCNKKGGRNEGY
jgi:iron only hydrogenase large subunit-like protein